MVDRALVVLIGYVVVSDILCVVLLCVVLCPYLFVLLFTLSCFAVLNCCLLYCFFSCGCLFVCYFVQFVLFCFGLLSEGVACLLDALHMLCCLYGWCFSCHLFMLVSMMCLNRVLCCCCVCLHVLCSCLFVSLCVLFCFAV